LEVNRRDIAKRRADIQSGSDSLDQEGGVDGRLKQRQLTRQAFDVHAVADLLALRPFFRPFRNPSLYVSTGNSSGLAKKLENSSTFWGV
jgi:hypothetical protein